MKHTTRPHRRLRSLGAVIGVCVALSASINAVATPEGAVVPPDEGTSSTSPQGLLESEQSSGDSISRDDSDREIRPDLGSVLDPEDTLDPDPEPESAEGETYFEPDHFTTQTLVDAKTGGILEVTSGVTQWERAQQLAPFARALTPLAAPVTEVMRVVVSPNTGTVSDTSLPKMRIDLEIPTAAKTGDTYVLALNLPWVFSSALGPGIEVKDAQGTVFALIRSVRVSGDGGPARQGALEVILTDKVEDYAAIKGFAEFNLGYWLRSTQQAVPVIVTSGGAEMAHTGNWIVPAEGAQTPTVSANGGYFSNGEPQIQPYIRLAAGRIPVSGWTVSFSELASGLSPSCVGYLDYRFPGNDGFIVDRTKRIEAGTCTGGTSSFVVPQALLNDIGASGGALVTFRSLLIGKLPSTYYTATLRSSLSLRAGETTTSWIVGATTGVPPTAGANSLFLNTAKTAAFTTSNGNTKPTLGDTVTYTITTTPGASNNRAITGLMTVDALPDGLQFISASGGGTYDSSTGKITWGPRILTSTGKFTDTVKAKIVTIPQSRSLVNTVANTADGVCTDGDALSTCSASVTTPVGNPAFEFKKSSTVEDTNNNGWVGDEGDTIRYAFLVNNTGDIALTSAMLTDDLLSLKSASCLAAGSILKPGQSQACQGTFTHIITAADVGAGEVTNHATLCVDPQFGLACKTDETTNPVYSPSFEFDKEIASIRTPAGSAVQKSEVSAGDIIRYRFIATNTGNADIEKLTVSDPMLGVKSIDCLPVGHVMKSKESLTCVHNSKYDYTVSEKDAEVGLVHNVAIGSVPGLPDDSGETTTPINPIPVDVQLPNTGGNGSWVFLSVGAGLLTIGLTVMIVRLRKSSTI